MASDGFVNKLIVSFAVFVLFAFLIVTFVVGIGGNYGRSADEIGDGSLDPDLFEGSLNNISGSADTYRERFDNANLENIESATGIKGIIDDTINLITTPFRLMSQVLKNILGIPDFFSNLIIGLISVSIVFGLWRLYKTGS